MFGINSCFVMLYFQHDVKDLWFVNKVCAFRNTLAVAEKTRRFHSQFGSGLLLLGVGSNF